MKCLDKQSEPYSHFGNISGSGISKILGAPAHDRLSIAVRETVQNSFDAAIHKTIDYHIGIRTLTDEQKRNLQILLIEDASSLDADSRSLQKSLVQDRIRIIEISDYGTSGLGGPLRADEPKSKRESTNFVDFVRNIGSPRDAEIGGGTYGYGKSSLFNLSRCQTVCVHSTGKYRNNSEERFITCRLGEEYETNSKRYTGRHWWGKKNDDGVVDPVTGLAASRIASAIGLPARGSTLLGTTLVVLDPDLEHRDIKQAMSAIQKTILWHLWPKQVIRNEHIPIRFKIFLEGVQQNLPALSDIGPLSLCKEALELLHDGGTADVHEIRCGNPSKKLGLLAIKKGPVIPRYQIDTGDNDESFPVLSSHIALMRPAELVVKYVEGPKLPSDMIEYAGLFICDKDVEKAFAMAEPPSHDDWIPDYLAGHEKTFVKVALRRINEVLRNMVAATSGQHTQSDDEQPALGIVADNLGNLLVGIEGTAVNPGGLPSRQGTGQKNQVSSVRTGVSGPYYYGLKSIEGTPCALFKIDFKGKSNFDLILNGSTSIVVEGGNEQCSADGDTPDILGWYTPDNQLIDTGNTIRVSSRKYNNIIVAVTLPGNYAVQFDLSVEVDE